MARNEVLEVVKKVAPAYNLDPLLVLAVCEQESSYDKDAIRLEQGYLKRYVLPQHFSMATSVLFSASYGVMQLMGFSLYELDYFDMTKSICAQIDCYNQSLKDQVETGCKWLQRCRKPGGTVEGMLKRYNGSDTYPPQVLFRYERLKKECATA